MMTKAELQEEIRDLLWQQRKGRLDDAGAARLKEAMKRLHRAIDRKPVTSKVERFINTTLKGR